MITSISVITAPYYVDCSETAPLRGFEASHIVDGLGMERFTVLYDTPLEELGYEALNSLKGIRDIELLLVATESSKDLSKPMGIRILERMGMNDVGTVELKFACVGGLYGLIFAEERAERTGRPVALLCMDEAIYDPKDGTAEMTQGSGAIGVLVKPSGGGLYVDASKPGYYTADVDDFIRPITSKTPVVNGKLSVLAYLFAMRMAVENWKAKNGVKDVFDYLTYFCFHVPFVKMAEWAFAYLYAHERLPSYFKYTLMDVIKEPRLYDEWRAERKWVTSLAEFKSEYGRRLEPSLKLSRLVGNLYTGSLFLSLASLILNAELREGDRIGAGGYGSGLGSVALPLIYKSPVELAVKLPDRKLEAEEYIRWRETYP